MLKFFFLRTMIPGKELLHSIVKFSLASHFTLIQVRLFTDFWKVWYCLSYALYSPSIQFNPMYELFGNNLFPLVMVSRFMPQNYVKLLRVWFEHQGFHTYVSNYNFVYLLSRNTMCINIDACIQTESTQL